MFSFFFFKREGEKNPDAVEFCLGKESFELVEQWASEEGISVEDVISKGISMYQIVRYFRKQGLSLASINEEAEVQAKLMIPGITTLEGDPSPSSNNPSRSL